MRLNELLREAIRDSFTQRIPSLLLFSVALTAVITALLTAGQHAARQALLESQLDSPGARLMVVREAHGSITDNVLQMVAQTSGISRVVGVVDVKDAEPTVPGVKIPTWIVSDISTVYDVTVGREPVAGEGVIDLEQLSRISWVAPAGSVTASDGMDYPVVSGGSPRPGFEDLTGAVIAQAPTPPSGSQTYQSLYILVDRIELLDSAKKTVVSYISDKGGKDIAVETAGLQIVNQLTSGKFAKYGELIILTVIVFASLITATVTLTYILLYRRLLGRRRALGITRTDLALLVLLRISVPVAVGAVAGAAIAVTISYLWFAPLPVSYLIAVSSAIMATSALVSMVPIVWAVNLDPVRILRVP